jgi:hypothetical protein
MWGVALRHRAPVHAPQSDSCELKLWLVLWLACHVTLCASHFTGGSDPLFASIYFGSHQTRCRALQIIFTSQHELTGNPKWLDCCCLFVFARPGTLLPQTRALAQTSEIIVTSLLVTRFRCPLPIGLFWPLTYHMGRRCILALRQN